MCYQDVENCGFSNRHAKKIEVIMKEGFEKGVVSSLLLQSHAC